MRLSILWRIWEIEEGVIRRGGRPRRITPSEISIILHMIRKPNSIIPYYLSGLSRVHFFSDNLSRNSCIWEHCWPLCQTFARSNSILACSDWLKQHSYSDCLTLTKLIRLGDSKLLYGKKLARLGKWPYYPKRICFSCQRFDWFYKKV